MDSAAAAYAIRSDVVFTQITIDTLTRMKNRSHMGIGYLELIS